VDGASAQGAGAKYGISFGANVPEELQRRDRSDLAEATRRRLEDAARKKEAEEGEKAAQRYQRRDYRPGRMTEGERKKKLEEMAVAADDHDAQRRSRLKEHEDKVAAEGEE